MSDAVTCTWLAGTPGGLSRLLGLPQEGSSSSDDAQHPCCSLPKPTNDVPCCLHVHLDCLTAAETLLHLAVSARMLELSIQRRGDPQPSYVRTMRGTPATQGPPGACKQWQFDVPLMGFPPHTTLQLKLLSHADRTQCHIYTCHLRPNGSSSQPDTPGPPQPGAPGQPDQQGGGVPQPAAAQSQMEELRALLAVASGQAPAVNTQQQQPEVGAPQQQGGVLLERLLQAPPAQASLMKSMSAAVARSLVAQQQQQQHQQQEEAAVYASATLPPPVSAGGSSGPPPPAASASTAAAGAAAGRGPPQGVAPASLAVGGAAPCEVDGPGRQDHLARGLEAPQPQQHGGTGAMLQAMAALQQQVAQLGAVVAARFDALEQRLGGLEAAVALLAQQRSRDPAES